MEVVFPDIPVPMTGFPEPGLLIVRGYEVGGLTIVVAVARGILVPVNNGVLVLTGGLDVVRTVTYWKGGKSQNNIIKEMQIRVPNTVHS